MPNWGRECRVEFQRPEWGRDALKQKVIVAWPRVARVWGFRRDVRDADQAQAEGQQAVRLTTVRFTVRWRASLAALTHDAQALCEGRTYQVTEVAEIAQVDGRPCRREWLAVTAQAKPDVGG